MAKPTTRAEFIAYCKRSLGAPVVEINVDDDQIDDRVDEALDYFYQYHSDGSEKVFLKHQVIDSILTTEAVATNFNNGETVTGTTTGAKFNISSLGISANYAGGGSAFGLGGEVTSGTFLAGETVTGSSSGFSTTLPTTGFLAQGDRDNGYIPVADSVTAIKRVFPLRDINSANSMFDVKYQMHLNDMFSLSYMGNLVDYEMAKQYMSLLDMSIDSDDKHFRYHKHDDKLYIDMNWKSEVAVGDYIVVEAYRYMDTSNYADVWNDYFLKAYATALIKKQWGTNMTKFDGMTMPGGVTFNGRQILDDANQEIEKLQEEARLVWEDPVDFMVG